MIAESRFIQIKFFSVKLGRNLLAKATLIKSDKSKKTKQVAKTMNLY
jgi:hypothetical protein